MNITIDKLADEVNDILLSYTQEVTDGTKNAVQLVAKNTVKRLTATSPKRTGAYAKNWTATVDADDKHNIVVIVHNKKYYRLTHVLENGHAKVGGGRVNGHPHIRPAETEAAKDLEEQIKVVIRK